MEDFIEILRHDLHKIKISGYLSHGEALKNEMMKKADSIAAMLGRNGNQFEIEESHPYRMKFISRGNDAINRDEQREIQKVIKKIFEISDPIKLHALLIQSTELNRFSESQKHPFSSLKYHLLLSCAFYYNLKHGKKWFELYLCENPKDRSEFQVIYRDASREWALIPESGMSRVRSKFHDTWDQRINLSIGDEDQVLEYLLSQIGSWSAALALIDEWNQE